MTLSKYGQPENLVDYGDWKNSLQKKITPLSIGHIRKDNGTKKQIHS